MKKLLLAIAIILPTAFALQSFDEKNSQPSIQADSVCFTRDILPTVNSNCAMAKCHDAITHKDNLTLTSYAGIMKAVKAGSSATSGLYREVKNNAMPEAPYNKLPDTLKTLIKNWIDQGAKNNTCAENPCDSNGITYTKDIKWLITTNCLGCHSGSAPNGGVSLEDDETNGIIKDRILCCVSHGAGCKAMPPNGINLSSCEVAKVRAWVNASTTNVKNDESGLAFVNVVPSVAREQATIKFGVAQEGTVTIQLYSYSGALVRTITTEHFSQGTHTVPLTFNGVAGGVYFVRILNGKAVRSAMVVH